MLHSKATMADVARLADVSPTTAARVIHNSGYVSEENRQRVLDAVQATGYRPNLQARSLRTQRSYSLGLVLSSARENPFFTNISHAVRTAAVDHGYSMLTVNHSYSQEAEISGVAQFLEHNVEAVILCHALGSQNFAPIREAGLPIIQIERRDIEGAHVVEIDPRPGLNEACSLLASLGHRNIAFIGGRRSQNRIGVPITAEEERADAFRKAAALAGFEVASCPVLLGEYEPGGQGETLPGYRLASQLLDDSVSEISAIIAGSDILVAGVLQALYERRLRVPDDISLIGYDDSMARFLSPPLSSIGQPYDAIGRAAIELVEAARRRPVGSVTSLTKSVATSLVSRHSVGSRQVVRSGQYMRPRIAPTQP